MKEFWFNLNYFYLFPDYCAHNGVLFILSYIKSKYLYPVQQS